MRRGLPRLERPGAAAAAIVVVVLFAGCGSSDSDNAESGEPGTVTTSADIDRTIETITRPAKSDDKLIHEALTAVFASGDPTAACEANVTPNYVITAYGDLDGCKAAQTSGAAADSVSVEKLAVAGGSAQATVVPSGGASSGEKIDVIMINDGTTWRIDSASANVPVGP